MHPNRKLVSESSKSKSELGTVSRLLTKIGKTDSKSLAWPIARPNGSNARLVHKQTSNQFLKVPLAEFSIPVQKLPKKKRNYEIQRNKGEFFHILMNNKNLGQAIDTRNTRATITMNDLDNVYLKYTEPRVKPPARKSTPNGQLINPLLLSPHRSSYAARHVVSLKKPKPMFTFGPDDPVDEVSRTPALSIIEVYKLPMVPKTERKNSIPYVALSTSIETMLNEISVPKAKDKKDHANTMAESKKEKLHHSEGKTLKKNHLIKKNESKYDSGKVRKNQRVSEGRDKKYAVSEASKQQNPEEEEEEEYTSNKRIVKRKSHLSQTNTFNAINAKKNRRRNKDAEKTFKDGKAKKIRDKTKDQHKKMTTDRGESLHPPSRISMEDNINERRFSSNGSVMSSDEGEELLTKSIDAKKSKRQKKKLLVDWAKESIISDAKPTYRKSKKLLDRAKDSIISADFRDMAKRHKRIEFRRSRLQDVFDYFKRHYKKKRKKHLKKNTLYETSLIKESIAAVLDSPKKHSMAGYGGINASILKRIQRDRIKLKNFQNSLRMNKSKINYVPPPKSQERGASDSRQTTLEDVRSKRRQANERVKRVQKPNVEQTLTSESISDYHYRYNKIKQYIESEMDLPNIENISIDDIDLKQFLHYPYNLQGSEVQETPKPIKTIRKSQSPAKSIVKKTEEPESPKPPVKCECHICVAIYRNRPIEDNPLIAKMKEELRRQELKAYIKNMQVFKSDRDRPYDSQYKFTSAGLLPYRKPQDNCFCQYPPIFCKKNAYLQS